MLIVDDDTRSRVAAAALLRGSANEIAFADSGPEALQLARDFRPDVILLDIMMPGTDGFEVCRLLRASSASADPPDAARDLAPGPTRRPGSPRPRD